MRITVVGAVAIIGAAVLLVLIVDRIIKHSTGNQNGNDEQPINPS